MKVQPDYKQTEVGVIPKDWKAITIGDAGEVLGGRQRSPHHTGEPTRYLRVANVFDGYIDTKDVLEMPFSPAERQQFQLRKGDILLNEGQSIDLVGRSAIYRGEPESCCFQNTLIRFRAGDGTCPEFVQFIFQQYLRTGVFASIALQTTSIAHLGSGRLAALKIPFPDKAEQEIIAEALGDASSLIESLEQLIAKKQQIKQGTLQELLTGKRRLPGFKTRWEVKRLGDLGEFFKGCGVTKDEARSGSLACVRYGELYTRHHDFIKTFHSWISPAVAATATRIRKGDILFAGSGETKEEIGKCAALIDDLEAYAGGDIVILRPAMDDPLFLAYSLNTEAARRQKASKGQGDAVVHISSRALADLILPLPAVPEQIAIAAVLSDMDAEIAALEAKLTKAHQLKQGMMQELLTGRIRLV